MTKPKTPAGRDLSPPHDAASPASVERPAADHDDAEVAAVWVPTDSLLPWAKNPRKNDGEPVDKVARSIERWGFVAPIIAQRTSGEVIAGHVRLKAAKKLGLARVLVRFVDLDPAEAHLYAVADNKLNELAEWDGPALAEVLSAFGLDDVEVAGFDAAELDKLAAEVAGPAGAEAPEDFKSYDESLSTEHTCPKCGYEF